MLIAVEAWPTQIVVRPCGKRGSLVVDECRPRVVAPNPGRVPLHVPLASAACHAA